MGPSRNTVNLTCYLVLLPGFFEGFMEHKTSLEFRGFVRVISAIITCLLRKRKCFVALRSRLLRRRDVDSTSWSLLNEVVNPTGSLVHEERFHGAVLLRDWAFFGKLQVAIHSPVMDDVQLWDYARYAYGVKWTLNQAYTISVLLLL